jgi:hypothetical protein
MEGYVDIALTASPAALGKLQDIRYFNPVTGTWQSSVPTFPFLNYARLCCTAVNTSGKDCYFFMYWYGFDSYGNRLYQHLTDTTLLAPGESITDYIQFFCDLPGTYCATCQLFAWPIGESSQLVDWVGTLDAGVPIAYVTGVPEIEASIDTWHLWDWETAGWVRPSPTLVPLHESIGIRGVAKNTGNTPLNMRLDVQSRAPSGALQTITGDVRSIPAGQWPYEYPRWEFSWEATEGGDWEADLILRAGPNLEVVDRMDHIAVANVSSYVPPPEYAGTITRKQFKYDSIIGEIPVSNVPLGTRGIVTVLGHNDMTTTQQMGIDWIVRDPNGQEVEHLYAWEGWPYCPPGDEHKFDGGRFDLDKAGTYTLKVDLLMNRASPVIVDSYEGDLCTTTLEVPPEYVLIQHTIYPYAYIYDGDVEVTTATFKTDPFTPAAWMGDKFTSKLEEEVRARGGRPLEVKVYVDTTPLFWTNFRIEVVGTPLGAEVASGIAVGIPIWAAILIIALAIIAVIVVATLAIKTIVGLFKTYPGLEDVKPGWGKETLMLTIHDSEEHWERPLTPTETLGGMSEAELRDHLDQIAEEEVTPEVSWWPLVLIGGLAVVSAGAAIAIAARRK